MKSLQELEMWSSLIWKLYAIPYQHRSNNYNAFYNEIQIRIDELLEELQLDKKSWAVPLK